MPSTIRWSRVALVLLVARCSEAPQIPVRPGVQPVVTSGAPRPGFYASPGGTSAGDGSWNTPWDLATALAGGNGAIHPGDTVWLRGGTYVGAFRSTVAGAAGAPVVVRQLPGERATVDGAGQTTSSGDMFVVAGDYSVFWGFELMNSDASAPRRVSSARPDLLVNDASHTKYVNLVVHDGGVAFFNHPTAFDVEVTGCIFYNNGWEDPVWGGGGHALYVKSNTGPVLIRDNVAFNQFGYGIQVYSDWGKGKLYGVTVTGNAFFNNGSLDSLTSSNANLSVGGQEPAEQDTVSDNMTFFSPGLGTFNVVTGLTRYPNIDIVFRNNYVVGGVYALTIGYWDRAVVRGNVVQGVDRVVRLKDTSWTGYQWDGNTYWRNPSARAWWYAGRNYTFAGWRAVTGLGVSDAVRAGFPGAPQVFVRPNGYETGRANVVVYNWTGLGAVPVDLSGLLQPGDSFAVRSVQDLFGNPVVSGTYGGGSISIPMNAITPPQPIAGSRRPPPTTGPAFDVFVVTKATG